MIASATSRSASTSERTRRREDAAPAIRCLVTLVPLQRAALLRWRLPGTRNCLPTMESDVELVNPHDLWPIMVPITSSELADMVKWLQDHKEGGLPLPLARLLVVGEYKLAHDRRGTWFIDKVVVEWKPKRKRWWRRTSGQKR